MIKGIVTVPLNRRVLFKLFWGVKDVRIETFMEISIGSLVQVHNVILIQYQHFGGTTTKSTFHKHYTNHVKIIWLKIIGRSTSGNTVKSHAKTCLPKKSEL